MENENFPSGFVQYNEVQNPAYRPTVLLFIFLQTDKELSEVIRELKADTPTCVKGTIRFLSLRE